MIGSLKILFSRQTINHYLRHLFLFISIISAIQIYLLYNALSFDIKKVKESLSHVYLTDGVDFSTMCQATNCTLITDGEIVYRMGINHFVEIDRESNIPYTKDWNIDNNLRMIVRSDSANITVVQDSKEYVLNVAGVYIRVIVVFSILFTILYMRNTMLEIRGNMFRQHKKGQEMESKLQRIISESAHHEMMLPVATIKTLSNELRKLTISDYCRSIHDRYSIECIDESNTIMDKRVYDGPVEDYFKRIENAISQLEVVLNQMSKSKEFKYSNGNKSIYDIVMNIDENLKTFRVDSRYSLILSGELTLKRYSVGGTLTNGELMNFISNHINNSIEAKSSKIVVQAKLNKDKSKMHLYITDNGIGIRDKYNNIISDKSIANSIFSAGMTTKDKFGNILVVKKEKPCSIKRFKQIISDVFKDEYESPRGVGMYINRQVLRENGGDLELMETSKRGTTFKMTFDIEAKKKS